MSTELNILDISGYPTLDLLFVQNLKLKIQSVISYYIRSITNLLVVNNTDIFITKNSTSPGIDGINPSIARSSLSLVYTPLSWIFNPSFNLGLILDSLNIAKITPIFKSCPKNLIYS